MERYNIDAQKNYEDALLRKYNEVLVQRSEEAIKTRLMDSYQMYLEEMGIPDFLDTEIPCDTEMTF